MAINNQIRIPGTTQQPAANRNQIVIPGGGAGAQRTGGYTGPKGGRTPLNILASMPGTIEGIIKGGLHFGIATPYATIKAGFHSALKGDLDVFPEEFNKIVEESATNVNLLGFKPFVAQTEAGQRFQEMFHEQVIGKISNHFQKKADLVFEATNNPALATGVRTVGELVGLLAPILGIKGATSLTKSVVDQVPARPIGIPGTDIKIPLGKAFYEDPKNYITFEKFDAEFKKVHKDYSLEQSQALYTEVMSSTKPAVKGQEVVEDGIRISAEDTGAQKPTSPFDSTMDPGIFLSTFSRYENPKTGKPYTDRALEKLYKRHVDRYDPSTDSSPKVQKIGDPYVKPLERKFRRGTALTEVEGALKNSLMKEFKELIDLRKSENKLLDPAINRQTAIKILEDMLPAVQAKKDGKLFSDTTKQRGVAEQKAIDKGYTKYNNGFSTKGIISKGDRFLSKYEVYQLRELAETGKIVLESEWAKTFRVEKSIFKDRQLTPEETVGMKVTPEGLKMAQETQAAKTVKEAIAKGPKEIKILSPKETKDPLEIYDIAEEMFKSEGGLKGKIEFAGGKYVPDNGRALLNNIKRDAMLYEETGELPKYRGLSTKQQSMVSKAIQGTTYKSITLLNTFRQKSPTAAKVIDSMVPPDIHLAIFDSKKAARRPRSADSFHTEKANRIGTFMTATLENNGFRGLQEIFHEIKPTILPGPQQLVRFGGKIMSAKDGLKVVRAIRGQGALPKGKLGVLVSDLQTLMRRLDDYIKEVFPNHETLANYFPQAWNRNFITKNRDQFMRDLTAFLERPNVAKEFKEKYGSFVPTRVAEEMTMNIMGEGRTMAGNRAEAMFSDIMNMSGKENMAEIKAIAKKASGVDHQRVLRDLPVETFEKYMQNDPYKGIQFYVEETVNRVEWARRYGEHNELMYKGIIEGVREANKNGYDVPAFVVERTLRLSEAMQGAYKMGGNKQWIKTQRFTTNILNAALLPLATVASLPEAMLPVYNGGIKAYGKALPPAIGAAMLMVGKNIHKDFKLFGIDKTRAMIITDQIRKSGDIAAMERMNALFEGDTSFIGNAVFRVNLLYYWTKWMNHLSTATYDAMVRDYFKSKAAGKKTGLVKGEEVRMERLMEYYGLDIAEGIAWSRGGAKLEGPFFEKLKRGAHMFAEDSVLTPNPATLPLWHSNPNLAWLRHLKTFPTLIGNRVISKWGMETYKGFHDQAMPVSGGRAGMYAIGTGMGLVTVAHVSNMINDYLRYGEKGNPLYKRKYKDFSENEMFVLRAVERAGIFGMGNFVFDSIFHSHTSLVGVMMGPTVAKSEALYKALSRAVLKHDGNALARELVKLTPVLNVNRETREDAIKVLQEFFRKNTFMDEGKGGWRAMNR